MVDESKREPEGKSSEEQHAELRDLADEIHEKIHELGKRVKELPPTSTNESD